MSRCASLRAAERQSPATVDDGAGATDEAVFRRVLGNVPTSVAIVTGQDGDGHFGLVVGSLVSISLRPSLVGMFIDNRSRTLNRLLGCERLCINVLAAQDAPFCRDFCGNRAGRFLSEDWIHQDGEGPRFNRALAWIAGNLDRSMAIGDHHLIVIAPDLLAENPACATSHPLVFFRGAFASQAAPAQH